jgi:apolipoprotein N-acyltransferase
VRRRLPRRADLLAVPVVWVGIEALRGLVVFGGFPWLLVEHPLIDAVGGVFVFPAVFGGIWLIGVLLAALGWLLDGALRSQRWIRWTIGAVVFAGAWGVLGLFGVGGRAREVPAAVVAVVQTNVPQSIKTGWSFDDRWADWLELREMLFAAGAADEHGERVDLIVVPETMFPGFVLEDDAAAIERDREVGWFFEPDPETGERDAIRAGTVRDELLEVSRRIGDVPIVIGATRYEGFRIEEDERGMRYESDARYNSAFLVRNGEVSEESYDKQHLTPFGEVMPYISNWPWLERAFLSLAAGGMSFNLEAGSRQTVFDFGFIGDPGALSERPGQTLRGVAPICFEATVGSVCRALLFDWKGGRRAGVMLNLTNDGWFYDAAGGREIHLQMARWRCLETATPMVRAANTGISCVIGPNGDIIGALEPFESGVLIVGVPGPARRPFAVVIGDAIGWFCLAGAIFGVGASYLPMHGRDDGGAPDAKAGTETGTRSGRTA